MLELGLGLGLRSHHLIDGRGDHGFVVAQILGVGRVRPCVKLQGGGVSVGECM